MPSIFDHDNTRWGILKTSCDFKNNSLGIKVNESVNQTVNKMNNFHGSSNGYYGYQMIPTNTESTDCAMDTSSEIVFVNETGCNISNLNFTNEFWRRKRSHPEVQEESLKRVKRQESEVPVDAPAEIENANGSTLNNSNDLPVYNVYRCTMSHYM